MYCSRVNVVVYSVLEIEAGQRGVDLHASINQGLADRNPALVADLVVPAGGAARSGHARHAACRSPHLGLRAYYVRAQRF